MNVLSDQPWCCAVADTTCCKCDTLASITLHVIVGRRVVDHDYLPPIECRKILKHIKSNSVSLLCVEPNFVNLVYM
jgi:succinate dehydrogenase hydrophobic anchor subunit